MAALKALYPWVKLPLIVSAPMLGAATPQLAVNVSRAGGMGFLAGGTDATRLDSTLKTTKSMMAGWDQKQSEVMPIGVGFQLFNSPVGPLTEIIARHVPAVIWLFAPKEADELRIWSSAIRDQTRGKTQIWIQVGSVAEAMECLELANPDVLVLQGNDAGGHGRVQSASIISLVPEVMEMLERSGRPEIPVLAAGGIVNGRGVAAALTLGASGAVMGTRFLVAEESGIANGWKQQLLHTTDGGRTTIRSTLCDRLKETKGWPAIYDGRAVRNQGHVDEQQGMSDDENIKLYQQEMKNDPATWDTDGRMVAYAGTGVGLVKEIQPAERIVEGVREETRQVLQGVTSRL